MKFPNMFSPVQIGTVTVPNRFVVPPPHGQRSGQHRRLPQ